MTNVDYTQYNPILSICTGIRGLERGLERIIPGLRAVANVEIEAFAVYNLVKAMEKGQMDVSPIWTDIKTFNARPFRGKIRGITAGYPCQGESRAGRREQEKDPRWLWPYVEKSICATQPAWCFFENTEGHLSGSFHLVLKSLRSMGYAVEAGIFSACEVGAPHHRQRLFILASTELSVLREYLAYCDGKHRNLSDGQEWQQEVTTQVGGKDVAHANGIGGHQSHGIKPPRFPYEIRKKWPAPPTEPQGRWEHDRIVESGVGCTVDGYDFRIDLVRLLGNSVMEDVAAKAFYMLVKKLIELNPESCKNTTYKSPSIQ